MMKIARLIIFIVLVCAATHLRAQQPDTLKILTSGRWQIEAITIDGKMQLMPEAVAVEMWMSFDSTGVYRAGQLGVILSGTWTYNPATRFIHITQKRKTTDKLINYRIISITTRNLEMQNADPEEKQEIARFKLL